MHNCIEKVIEKTCFFNKKDISLNKIMLNVMVLVIKELEEKGLGSQY